MRNGWVIVIVAACMLGAWAEDAPPVVNGGGAGLSDLVGKDKLVSVVLKESGAVDQNLRVVDVGPNYFAVLSHTNERVPYLFSSVAEVRVQDGKIERKKVSIEEGRSLKIEEQKVVERAIERAREIFDAASSAQPMKMRAAVLLAIANKEDAHEYLRRLAASNDLETQVDALTRLYLVGDTDIPASAIAQGLQSGNRKIKAKAATLAGLVGDKASIPALLIQLQDRAVDVSGPAARALARLGYREAIPKLFQMIMERDEEKGRTAVFALTRLGGDDIIQQAKQKIAPLTEQDAPRFRLILLLYKLGAPGGKELLAQTLKDVPTQAPDAALLLARENQWDAVQLLAGQLRERHNNKDETLLFRANAAAALVESADSTAVSYLQELLRSESGVVKMRVCTLVTELGRRRLIPLLQPTIESVAPGVALEAGYTVLAIAKPEFRQRLIEVRN